MTRQELELKAKAFDSKLKRHPMSSEELQKVLCDFAEALRIYDLNRQSEQFVCGANRVIGEKKCEKQCGQCEQLYAQTDCR